MDPSKVWQYFKCDESNDFVKCLICNYELMNDGTTSPLWAHYNTWHKKEKNTSQSNNKRVHDEVEQRDNEQIATSTDQIASKTTDQATSTSTDPIASTSTDQIASISTDQIALTSIESPLSLPFQKRLKLSNNTVTKDRPSNGERKEQITHSICQIITNDLLPFSFVENKGLKNLMDLFEPNYQILNQKTISTLIEKLHEDKVNYTKNLLESINGIALTTDGWSSQAIDSCITYTGHYINKNWTLCNVISIKELIESHTADHFKEEILELMDEWNITNKVTGITHDNASNIIHAVRNLEDQFNFYSNKCAAHTIQLAIKKGLVENVCSTLLETTSSIVATFKPSPKQSNALPLYLQQTEQKELALVQSCPTRWNSYLAKLERLLVMRRAVVAEIIDEEYLNERIENNLEMLEEDWDKCEVLVKLLKPLQLAMTIIMF